VRVAPFLHIELGICETGRPGCVRLDDAARDRPLRLEVHDEVESLSRAVDAGNRFANTIHHPRSAGGRQYEAPWGTRENENWPCASASWVWEAASRASV